MWPFKKLQARAQPEFYEAPTNVRVRRASGEETPVDLSFNGVDEDGNAEWLIDTPVKMFEGDSICAATIPPHAGIVIRVPLPGSDSEV